MNATAAIDFRSDVRAWLEAHCPPEMRTPMMSETDICWGGRKFVFSSKAQEAWLKACVDRGYTVPTWPKAYGGAGLSGPMAAILEEEMRAIGARPPLVSFGILMLGPALLHFGNEAQKAEHLPPIARGEIRWCQGYSEPGSGSDLASLATRATVEGEAYVIHGQKIWTSYADRADWIFCLVRTDASTKHGGISFVLLDMDQSGIDARPISLISGKSPFCEVFFDGARAQRSNCIGGENQGWTVAKTLLAHERQSIGSSSVLMNAREWVVPDVAKSRYGLNASGRLDAPILRTRIAQLEVDRISFEALTEETQAEYLEGRGSPTIASLVKYYGAELNKRRHEMLMSVEGQDGLTWESSDAQEGDLVRAWLRSKANSIEGGTNEIQLNILARHALGLPTS